MPGAESLIRPQFFLSILRLQILRQSLFFTELPQKWCKIHLISLQHCPWGCKVIQNLGECIFVGKVEIHQAVKSIYL